MIQKDTLTGNQKVVRSNQRVATVTACEGVCMSDSMVIKWILLVGLVHKHTLELRTFSQSVDLSSRLVHLHNGEQVCALVMDS